MNNNMNEHPHLKKWCEKHYANTNISVYPQTVPVQTLLDEVLARLETLEAAMVAFCAKTNETAEQVEDVQGRMQTAEKKIEQKRRVKEVKK